MEENIENENIKAFEKLLTQKEIEEKGKQGRWTYYEDLYGNRYGWYIARQKDGKFHAFIYKKRTHKSINRIFAKKKKGIAWVYRHYSKHNDRQVKARESRREKALARKPVLTEKQITLMKYRKQIDHYTMLQKKNNKKIKTLTTRSKTYNKRIKYCLKKLDELNKSALLSVQTTP